MVKGTKILGLVVISDSFGDKSRIVLNSKDLLSQDYIIKSIIPDPLFKILYLLPLQINVFCLIICYLMVCLCINFEEKRKIDTLYFLNCGISHLN